MFVKTRLRVGLVSLALTMLVGTSSALAQDSGEDAGAPLVGKDVTLQRLLDLAEENAPDVQVARERTGLGGAAVRGAERFQPYNPEIEGQLGVGLDAPGVRRAEVTLKQRLEVAGQRGQRIEAARTKERVLEAELDAARWRVSQEIRRLYRQALVDRRNVEVEDASLEFTRRLHRIAGQRFEAGEAARTSVIIARAEVARAKQRRLDARMDYDQTVRELATVVGWEEQRPPKPTGELEQAAPAPETDRLLEAVVAQDPTLNVFRARLEQAQADVDVRRREVWPDPIVGVGFERERIGTSGVASQLRFVLGVPLPLWNRNQGEIGEARARTSVYRRAIETRTRALRNRVAQRAAAVDAAFGQAQIYQEEVLPALETQLDLLQEGFELGELSLLDVMNARDRLLAVQRQYLGALREYYLAISELEALLGTAIEDENTKGDDR
jgi:cobalt-zinc-cadmium efflux system outer membrane protein